MTNTVDITPTPRILRTLGDIPFEVWQCLAELADNSLDAFRDSINAIARGNSEPRHCLAPLNILLNLSGVISKACASATWVTPNVPIRFNIVSVSIRH